MKVVILLIELYVRIVIGVVHIAITAGTALGQLCLGVVNAVIYNRQIAQQQQARQQLAAQREVHMAECAEYYAQQAARRAAIAESVGYKYSAESESYYNLAKALEEKAKEENDKVKRAKLQQQAATAYRKAEQLASKCPDYLKVD